MKKLKSILGLTVEQYDIPLVINEDEDNPVCGTMHLLLKYSKNGDDLFAKGYSFGWPPLSIELCLTDDDDLDKDIVYNVGTEKEFDEYVAFLASWCSTMETSRINSWDFVSYFRSFVPQKFIRKENKK